MLCDAGLANAMTGPLPRVAPVHAGGGVVRSPSTRPRSSSARSRPASPWPGGRGRPVRCSPGPSGTWRPSSPCRPRARPWSCPSRPAPGSGSSTPPSATSGGGSPRPARPGASPTSASRRRTPPRSTSGAGGGTTRSPAPSRRCAHSRRPARRARSPSPSSRSPRSRPGSAARRTAGPTRSRPWRSGAPSAWARSAVYHAFALGLLAQGTGRPDTVAELLEPIVDYTAEQGLGEPATVMWQPELVEAFIRLGRTVDARRALATLAEQADRTGGAWSRAAASRCRGLLDDDFDRHFAEALRLHDLTPMPFERARTELAYGARLRRARRRAEGRTVLGRALATFEELGAAPGRAAPARRSRRAARACRGGGPAIRRAVAPRAAGGRTWRRGSPTGRSRRGCSCRRRRSSATWAASTASSACARAPSWRGASPGGPRPAGIRLVDGRRPLARADHQHRVPVGELLVDALLADAEDRHPEKSTGSPRAGQGPRSVAWVPRSLHSVHTRSSLPSLSALTSSSRSGTEAMNWAIRSAMAARPANRGKGDPPMCGGASTRHSRTPSGAKHPRTPRRRGRSTRRSSGRSRR